jgi:hypothetical protein
LDNRVGIGTSTSWTQVEKSNIADLADAHFSVLSPQENDFKGGVQLRPTKKLKKVCFEWFSPELKNSKKMGRGQQYQQVIAERVGGHRQLGVQLGEHLLVEWDTLWCSIEWNF